MKRIVLGVVLALLALVVVLNWTWGRLPDEPARTGRLVRIGETTVRLIEHQDSGPAIVLIHGLPGTAQDFDEVAAQLPERHTIAYDRPGFGFSEGGYHPFAEQLELLANLLHAHGTRRPILVGHSYGGTLALAFAAKYPDAVGGLVLIDAAAAGHEASFTEGAQVRLLQVLSWPVVQPVADATFSQLMRTVAAKQGDTQAFDPRDVDRAHEDRLLALNMRHEDLDAYVGEELEAEDVIADLDRRLVRISTPTVVIQGDGDQLVAPERGRTIAATLPYARLVMVNGGHMAPYDHPGVVAAAVRELAESVMRSPELQAPGRARSAAR